MAIYSCNLCSIGRTTHAAGTAGAHLRYIGRRRAAAAVMAAHMPEDVRKARSWMDRHERSARKNARLCDKLRIALPRELTEAQRGALVQAFMADLTGGRVPWYAAIHQTGRDAHNPHAHIVVVDRDIETGRRVLGLSDSTRDRRKKGLPGPAAVEWVRERWEHHANQALERAGHAARIDRRSLEAQGIERTPQIHIGPRAQHIDTAVHRPESKAVPSPSLRNPARVVDYPLIDAGRTRRERNAEIIDLNIERAARSGDFETRLWAQFEREQRAQDRVLESALIAAARRRSLQERRIRQDFAARLAALRARRDAALRLARSWLRQRYAPDVEELRRRHEEERAALSKRQRRVLSRLAAIFDLTGRTKISRAAERQALTGRHKEQRQALAAQIRAARAVQAEAVSARYRAAKTGIEQERLQALARLQEGHGAALQHEDRQRQAREAGREQARSALELRILNWKQAGKAGPHRGLDYGP